MTARTNRPAAIEIEPGVHLLRAENHDTAVVLLVVREGRLEVWLRLQQNAAPAPTHTSGL